MKRIVILFVIIILMPIKVTAQTIETGTPYGTYEDAKKMIKEAMIDYYIRGNSIQYNFPRASQELPEEATPQDRHYLVCGTYTYQAYRLAFGAGTGMPKYQTTVETKANEYYQESNPSLIYYYDNNGHIQYPNGETTGKMSVSDFAQYIEPGDLFDYDGHVMIAYDKIQKEDGTWDVLMLHSHQENANQGYTEDIKNYIYDVRRGISSATAKLSINTFTNRSGANKYLDIDIDDTIEEKKFQEGSVQVFWLSNQKMLVNKDTGKMWCHSDYSPCSVIRLFHEDEENNAIFDFEVDSTKYNTTKDIRVEYPGLYIEKTVDNGDNNGVYLGDVLTYKIKIKNKSKINYDKPFYVKETINTNLVDFAETYPNVSGNTIVFENNSLDSGSEIILTYKIKVKYNIDNINNTITSTGKFLKEQNGSLNIATGTVENIIMPKVNNRKQIKSYNNCYQEKKIDNTGLDLINEIYKCAWNIDYNINDFDFYSIFNQINISSTSTSSILLKYTDNPSIYKNMILNNYYNEFKHKDDYYHHIHWNETGIKTSVQGKRQKDVKNLGFKDGDILIYESHNSTFNNEDGIYAYIYLIEEGIGRFIGINHKGTEHERNNFTYDYYVSKNDLYGGYNKLIIYDENYINKIMDYANFQTLFDKDWFIILRPELIMEDIYFQYDTSRTYKQIEPQIISNIIDKIDSPSITVYDINNNIINNYNVNIGTGTKLQFDDSETYVSVIGDVDGDGISNTSDAIEAFKYLRNKNTYANNGIKEAVSESVDTVKDSGIKINDIAKLYQYTKGKINSLE